MADGVSSRRHVAATTPQLQELLNFSCKVQGSEKS